MSVAALGALLGGYEQGQERQQAQKERAAYLLSLQQRQQKQDAAENADQEARAGDAFDKGASLFDPTTPAGTEGSTLGTDGEGGGPVARVFGANAAPLTGPGAPQRPQPPQGGMPPPGPAGGGPGGAPAMPPGMASQPGQPPQQMAMPGAQPMPGAGQPPPQGGMPPPGAARPMPQGQPGGPQQMPPQARPQAPQPGAPPQGQQPQQPASQQTLADLTAKLATPESQRILNEPDVQEVRKRYHAYVEGLRKDGVDPTGQNGRKPTQIEMRRLQLLHQELGVVMTDAAKHVTNDANMQEKLGIATSHLYAQKEGQTEQMKREEMRQDRMDGRKAMGGGGAGGAPTGDFNSWTDEQKQGLKKEYEQFGPNALPWARSMKGGSQQIEAFDKWRLGTGNGGGGDGRGAGTANYKADAKALGTLQQTADVQQQRYSTLDKNVDLMLSMAQKYGLKGSTPINQVVNALRGTTDPSAKAFLTAVATVQREYGKLADGGSGAAGAHVESLKNAGETINGNFTYDQLQAVAKTLKADGKNVIDSYGEQIGKIKGRISGSGAAPGGGAPFKASNGKEYSPAAVQDAAKRLGMTPEEFMKAAGGG